MNKRVMIHKKTGEPVQVVAQAQTKPNYQDVICYQELTAPYEYYVMERRSFFATYARGYDELPDKGIRKEIEKRQDLPDKRAERRARKKGKLESTGSDEAIEMEGPIGMGGPIGMDGPVARDADDVSADRLHEDESLRDSSMRKNSGFSASTAQGRNDEDMNERMMLFLDAKTYAERIRIFETMRDASEHVLTNIAVSLDIPLEDGIDNYERVLSELKLRKKYEVTDRR